MPEYDGTAPRVQQGGTQHATSAGATLHPIATHPSQHTVAVPSAVPSSQYQTTPSSPSHRLDGATGAGSVVRVDQQLFQWKSSQFDTLLHRLSELDAVREQSQRSHVHELKALQSQLLEVRALCGLSFVFDTFLFSLFLKLTCINFV